MQESKLEYGELALMQSQTSQDSFFQTFNSRGQDVRNEEIIKLNEFFSPQHKDSKRMAFLFQSNDKLNNT